jgi:hypothetical protein
MDVRLLEGERLLCVVLLREEKEGNKEEGAGAAEVPILKINIKTSKGINEEEEENLFICSMSSIFS